MPDYVFISRGGKVLDEKTFPDDATALIAAVVVAESAGPVLVATVVKRNVGTHWTDKDDDDQEQP